MRSRHLFLTALIVSLCVAVPTYAQLPVPAAPAPAASPLVLDLVHDNVGIAQQTAQEGRLQGRILWMDAGANVGSLNSTPKVRDIVAKVKAAGFNMIVLDVKPIVGDTVYPSRFAPKLTAWKGQTVAADFDVLREMLTAAHAAGLPVYANMSTFGEGHKYVRRGLAYTHPDWQTTLYEVDRGVSVRGGPVYPVTALDALPRTDTALTALTGDALLHENRPGDTVAVLNFAGRVLGVYDGGQLQADAIRIPPLGVALVGHGIGPATGSGAMPAPVSSSPTQPRPVSCAWRTRRSRRSRCSATRCTPRSGSTNWTSCARSSPTTMWTGSCLTTGCASPA